jgi:LPS-assembly protein
VSLSKSRGARGEWRYSPLPYLVVSWLCVPAAAEAQLAGSAQPAGGAAPSGSESAGTVPAGSASGSTAQPASVSGSTAKPASASGSTAPFARASAANAQPASGNLPVTFLADGVSYDKNNSIVSATGHVQAWQNGHYLSADRVTFDRNTDVAAAYGHVTIVEPDGEIVFGDYAELSQGMKNGVITGMRALLANGGKMAANGARRTDGKLNELSRAVYTSCNVCALDPTAPLTWQIRANHLTQDLEHKRIEYSDAWLDVLGVPVLYMPYMSNSDPSVKRQSGFLSPSIGTSSNYLGAFVQLPYYWVLDGQSDALITPEISSQQGGQVEADYRRWFNEGRLDLKGAVGQDENKIQGFFFGSANFNWNDTWRYGANINLGTSVNYLRDYQIPGYGGNFLGSNVYVEGFGIGAYSRLDVSGYQGLNASIAQSSVPYALPRYIYSYLGEPDWLGGRFSFDTEDFNVLRQEGADVQRVAARAGWDRPFAGLLGEQYQVTAEVRAAAYNANVLDGQPDYGTVSHSTTAHAQPQVSVKVSWPFVRDGGSLGTQTVEPILQVIAAPQAGNALHDHLPNEDSLAYEFSDSTLFSLNRFGGYDRFEGGARANFALHGNWTFPGGQVLDGLVGASAIQHIEQSLYPVFQPSNGFDRGSHVSDVVARAQLIPNKWIDFTTRARIDHRTGNLTFADVVTGFGRGPVRFHAGYLYASTDPYVLFAGDPYQPGYLSTSNNGFTGFYTPRNEVNGGVSLHYGRYSVSGDAMRNLETGQMDSASGHLRYEDPCTALDFLLYRRYTSINGDHGNTTLLFTITLKTVGQFGFK